MGIVVKQSIQNTISTYTGFAIGAINTLFLYTNFLSDAYYGLVGFLLSAATIMTPLVAFGVHNTLIKFYSYYKTKREKDNFFVFILYLPLLVIIPIAAIGSLAYEQIVQFLSNKNEIIESYVVSIFLIAIAMAYFEIFYARVKVQMKSALGNFMKEVYHRAIIMVLLIAVYFDVLSADGFVWSLVAVYFSRLLIMKLYAFKLKLPKLTFQLPENYQSIISYSLLIIIAGSISLVLLDIDKVMIGKYLAIENVAYYNVAIFIAMVIAVPARAMHQITYPITAQLINNSKWEELKLLYSKSSLTLFIISGWVFLLIVLNINQLYHILPEDYSSGWFVVLLISFSKLIDNLLGINNAILYNSDYYRWTIILGVFLAILTVVLNLIFIPLYGINGAAIATFLSLFLYSISKIIIVNLKFKMQPFDINTAIVIGVLFGFVLLFYFWDFGFHPILNIIIKSSLVSLFYTLIIIKGKVSEDINLLFQKIIKSKS